MIIDEREFEYPLKHLSVSVKICSLTSQKAVIISVNEVFDTDACKFI
jgi:hypothetical protein